MRRHTPRCSFFASTVLILLTFFISLARSETVRVFSLNGEGTAIVYVSDNTKKALITDGGKRGEAGLSSVTVDGKSVLRWLRDRGVTTLAIECSHPDSDHLDALVEMIRTDATLREFDNLYFIDSGFRKGKKNASKSLYEHYQESQGAAPKQPKTVKPISAENNNAFAEVFNASDEIYVRNFEYMPADKAPAHGHTIITESTIRHAGTNGLVEGGIDFVDFDDGNSELVKRWCDENRNGHPIIDVFVVPHHGSDGTNIDPILALKPRACVFTVNSNNQYGHPSPKNLWKCIQAMKVENVHVTAGTGDLVVTSQALQPIRDQAVLAAMFEQSVRHSMKRCERDLASFEELAAARPLDRNEQEKLRGLAEDYDAFINIEKAMTSRESKPKKWLVAVLGGNDFARPFDPGRPPDDDATPGPAPKDTPPPPPSDNTGSFRETLTRANEMLGNGGGEGKAEDKKVKPNRFKQSFDSEPVWGGIMLGNDIKIAPIPTRASIEIKRNRATIVVHLNDGSDANYSEMTNSELWSAFQFVTPPPEWTNSYGLQEGEPGLLSGGIRPDHTIDWSIHPAIANTLIARDAMLLDVLLGRTESKPFPDGHPFAPLNGRTKLASQWFDEKSVIIAKDGLIEVQAAEKPADVLLRLRAWGDAQPKWMANGNRDEAIAKEEARRIAEIPGARGAMMTTSFQLFELQEDIGADLGKEEAAQPAWLKNVAHGQEPLAYSRELRTRVAKAMDEKKLADTPQGKLLLANLDAAVEVLNAHPELVNDEMRDDHRRKLQDEAVKAFEKRAADLNLSDSADFRLMKLQMTHEADWVTNGLSLLESAAKDKTIAESDALKAMTYEIQISKVANGIDNEIHGNVLFPASVFTNLQRDFEPFARVDRFAKTVAVLRWLKSSKCLPQLPAELRPIRSDVKLTVSLDSVEEFLK